MTDPMAIIGEDFAAEANRDALLEAAPDMLAALRAILSQCSAYQDGEGMYLEVNKLRRTAHEAISKAEGRS